MITEFLSSPEALFVGKAILATSMFLMIYTISSKVNVFPQDSTNKIIAMCIASMSFIIVFPPTGGMGSSLPFIWTIAGYISLIALLFSVAVSKFTSGFGLMTSQLGKRSILRTIPAVVSFMIVIFLPQIAQLLYSQLGEFFPLAFNLAWLLDFLLATYGAIKGSYVMFLPINWLIADSEKLAESLTIVFLIVAIFVIPQMVPYAGVVTKLATVVGILSAAKFWSGRSQYTHGATS